MFSGGWGVCDDGRMLFSVLVEVSLREGVADPQGATIERSLPHLGFDGVGGVRVGKAIRFDLEAADEAAARAEVDDLCQRFLTNPASARDPRLQGARAIGLVSGGWGRQARRSHPTFGSRPPGRRATGPGR